MTRLLATGAWLLAILSVLVGPLEAFAEEAPRRWALVVGENQGLPGEERLRFAESDARRMREVLQDVGTVPPERTVMLLGTDAATLREALARFQARLSSEASSRDWLVLYISSHAGDGRLHLRGTELPMRELVDFLKAAPVGVGLLILDSCRSGLATRLKGLKPVATPITMEAADLEGRVVISASGADEYAQESDALQGSYFTHHLAAGLRGAADASRDGRVTLEEAYRYAYARTLESTLVSPGGLQRPTFRMDLRGRGELVLSEPLQARGRLTLDVKAPGRWLVLSSESGTLVAELEKGEGPTTLAVAPGAYRILLRADEGFLERSVTVPLDGNASVGGAPLEQAARLRLARKGGAGSTLLLAVGPSLTSGIVAGLTSIAGMDLRLEREGRLMPGIDTAGMGFAVRRGSGRRQPFRQTELELRLGAGPHWTHGPWTFTGALEAGALAVIQTGLPFFEEPRFGLEPLALVSGGVRLHVRGGVSTLLSASAGGVVARRDSGVSLVPRASASLMVGFAL
ncbi:caspase family protein [Corallococcus llansteffanensis]|uniref:Caspase family protein n=1 Tax=Corallococcus llansteffanensis TaxID=2316731 RepID=A0A3A8NPA6_9BACT|nr:caspase family protein [Corallococcus llansteffanensis]RKH41812.1 caspase family protein [Corallococcus llansteffanensis]